MANTTFRTHAGAKNRCSRCGHRLAMVREGTKTRCGVIIGDHKVADGVGDRYCQCKDHTR